MVMRVGNDKAIIVELGQTKNKADDSDIEKSYIKSPKFDSRSASNTAILGVYHVPPPHVPAYYSKPHPYSVHPPVVIQPVRYVQDYPQ